MRIGRDCSNSGPKNYSTGFFTALILAASTYLAAGQTTQLVWGPGGGPPGPGQDGSGTWDLSTAVWNAFSSTQVPWVDGSVAYIGQVGGTAGTITVGAPVKVSIIYFNPVG